MRLVISLLLEGILLFGCTPTVKKVVFHKPKDDVVVVKRSSFKLTPEEKTFVKKEARKFGIEVPEREEIEKFIRLYLRDKRGMRIALRRASLYVPYIKPILKEYGLPEELALLPLIESGFNPFAVSRSGAAGIWQLMPQTARRFGLRVDSRVDERFDLIKSTHAAARYLKELYDRFGSWELALAAYNCGEGCVQRRTGSRDFWRTKWALPEQTRKYVPMFFAALLIARSPEKYGLSVDADLHLFEKRVARGNYRVKEFIRRTGLKESTFRDLNPHIKGDYIPAGVYVYVPKGFYSETRPESTDKKVHRPAEKKKVKVAKRLKRELVSAKTIKKKRLVKKAKSERMKGRKLVKRETAKIKAKPSPKKVTLKVKKYKVKKLVAKLSRKERKIKNRSKVSKERVRVKLSKPEKRKEVVKAVDHKAEFAPRLIIRSEEGEEVRSLERKTRVITLENGALLYIKE